jgi:glycosyltransferase involved in cell wall biosynthesis
VNRKTLSMRVSIITLTTDSSRYVDEAIGGVTRGGLCELEHIVVHDGTDGFIERLAGRYPHVKLLRGNGAGATAAAALGVRAATGDFILFVHSDDRIRPEALGELAIRSRARPDVRIWSGGAQIFCGCSDGDERIVRRMAGEEMTRLSLENICDDTPLLSARFCHRSVFSQIGNFDPEFSESSDREFLLRAAIAGVPEASLGVDVSEMRMHQESRTIRLPNGSTPPYLEEHARIASRWLGHAELSAAVRRFLCNWRAREMLRLIVYQGRAGQWRKAALAVLRELSADPLWMFRTLTIIGARRRRHRSCDWNAVDYLRRDQRAAEARNVA